MASHKENVSIHIKHIKLVNVSSFPYFSLLINLTVIEKIHHSAPPSPS